MVMRKRERERERERETYINVREKVDWLNPIHTPTRDWTNNLGMCPDQELNLYPFDIQDDAPTSWIAHPGLDSTFDGRSSMSLQRWEEFLVIIFVDSLPYSTTALK